MASRKKLRKRFFNGEVSLASLSEDEKKYLEKYIRRLERDTQVGKEYSIPTFKEVPCQKIKGKMVLIPIDANVTEGEDGLLYFGDKLIVSDTWKHREEVRKTIEAKRKKDEEDKAVTELKPTKLGEE